MFLDGCLFAAPICKAVYLLRIEVIYIIKKNRSDRYHKELDRQVFLDTWLWPLLFLYCTEQDSAQFDRSIF
jgi:hypothetical protein